MKLNQEFKEFKEGLNELKKQGENILSQNHFNISKVDFQKAQDDEKVWKENVIKYLDESLNEKNNIFTQSFKQASSNKYIVQNLLPDNQLVKNFFDSIKEKTLMLDYISKLISISDKILYGDTNEILERKKFNIKQKLELILEKLYDLNDNRHHDIENILELNGIELNDYDESRELVKVLENQNYIDVIHGRRPNVKININGRMYIEEKREKYEEDYDSISSEQKIINEKIDEIIFTLKKLGFGQEIIFEEIEELKELYTKLNKKNWGQVLKGKLIDLSLSKLVENETINYIYHSLTQHDLKLP